MGTSSPYYFDASNVLSWGPQPAVGIPRVETALVREALRAGHNVFLYDRKAGTPRQLSLPELEHLRRLLSDEAARAGTPGPAGAPAATLAARVARARHLAELAQGRAGAEFERYLAGVLTGDGRRQGAVYEVAKVLVRAHVRAGRPQRPAPAAVQEASAFVRTPQNRLFLSSRTTHDLTYAECRIDAQTFAVLHDLIPLRGEPFFSARNAARFLDEASWIASHCARVLCPSDFTRDEARRRFPQSASKFATAHPAGLLFEATRDVSPAEPALPHGLAKPFVLYCATIEPRKNHAMLAEIWTRLHERMGPACPALYLVGRWGWNCADAEAGIGRAQAAGAPVARLTGLSDAELVWLYRHAVLGVYPSLVEGFGLGVAECLDFGLPVLVSDAAALAEAAQGLMPVLPATDSDAWLVTIERLLRSERELAALRQVIARDYVRRSARDFFARVLRVMSDEREAG